jgi:hypothetical protein
VEKSFQAFPDIINSVYHLRKSLSREKFAFAPEISEGSPVTGTALHFCGISGSNQKYYFRILNSEVVFSDAVNGTGESGPDCLPPEKGGELHPECPTASCGNFLLPQRVSRQVCEYPVNI